MNIAILTNHFPPYRGGISRYTYEIAYHLKQHGANLTVFSSVPPKEQTNNLHSEFSGQFVYLPFSGKGYWEAFRVFKRCLSLAKQEEIDLLFFSKWTPYALFAPFFPFSRNRYVVGTHGAEILDLLNRESKTRPIIRWMGCYALRNAQVIFAVSNYTAHQLSKLQVPNSRIQVFPNGVDYTIFTPQTVDKEEFLSQYPIDNPSLPLLLTVAQLNPRKGIDNTLRAVANLISKGREVNYVVIGKGEDESRLRGIIKRMGLEGYSYIFTDISDEELLKFYNISNAFILFSRKEGSENIEGFGIALLEANACGIPVIAGRSGGIPDAVVDGETGFLLDPLDIEALAMTIKLLLENPEQARLLGKQGRERIVEEYNWEKITSNMLTTLKQTFNKS